MNLIFIYGPPATGKLTVAKELSILTNYPVFHNHLTYDLAFSLFKGYKFGKLIEQIRLDVFQHAINQKLSGLIFTVAYGYGSDDQFVKSVIKLIEKSGNKINFVQLKCSREELHDRVNQDSRQQFGKVKDVQNLDELLNTNDYFTPISFVKNLIIDNTSLDPKTVAEKIMNEFAI
ncbi:MAG: AAA family ATPase [Microgenomates group bacterium]